MRPVFLTLLCALWLTTGFGQIVINEIMYNPPESGEDSLEYIELYNPGNAPVNLNGYQLIGVGFTFGNVTIASQGFVVVAKKPSAIQNLFGYSGALQFPSGQALSNSGELIQLLNATGALVDSVRYDENLPWDANANGNGSSLELCDPTQDNGVFTYWVASTAVTGVTINNKMLAGSPGTANQTPCPPPPSSTVANDDSYTIPFGQSATLNVLANDVVVNPPFTVTVPPNFQLGTLVFNNNGIQFTPNGQCGTAVFTYTITDQAGVDSANVTVNVPCPTVYPIYTIAQVKGVNAQGVADSLGVACELSAVVHGVNLRSNGLQFYMIDETGTGIGVFNSNKDFGYMVSQGDKITVRGQIGQFAGLTQILADTVWKISANNPLQTPQVVTTLSEASESRLIKLECLTLNPAQWDTTGNPAGFNLSIPNGQTIRIDNNVAMYLQPAPFAAGSKVTVIGIGSQFDNSLPHTEGYQLIPMFPSDFQICSSVVEASTIGFSAHPNPATDVVTFDLPVGTSILKIYDSFGRLMFNEVTQRVAIDTWTSGTYHAIAVGSFGTSVLRLVKL